MSHPTLLSVNPVRLGFLPWLGLAVLLAATLVAPSSARADSDPAGADEEVVASVDRPDYHYEAPKGSNLTYMARRSLQLETEGSGVITGAPLVATETCLVQALGADDLIYVGEPIVVGGQLIDDCLEQTSQLTEAQLECWAAYLPIRENLDWIEPTMVQTVAGVGEEAPGDLLGIGEISVAEAETVNADPAADNDGLSFSSWYWWLIVGFVFGLGWYFMVLGRTWRSAPESLAGPEDDKKMSQPEDDSTSVETDSSDSQETTNKKSKSRRRRSKRS